MRILFASDVSIARVIGGAERVLYEQATRLAERGHKVIILTRLLPEHERKQEVIRGVEEWRYQVDRKNALTFFFSTRINAQVVLMHIGEKGNFDVINGHQPFTAGAVLSTPVARRVPLIYTCHSLAFEEYLTRNSPPPTFVSRCLYYLRARHLRRWERNILHFSKHVIALSDFTRDKLTSIHKVPEGKITIIPGGVDTERFQPPSDRMEIRKKLNLPTDRVILLTVRNLVPRMGLENLIQAMAKVKQARPEVLLYIGGTGPLKETLLRLVHTLGLENHVFFTGFIPEDELPLTMGAADCFVLPTIALEGFGLVTVEALACGTPVLGTPIGGTVEILRELDDRLLFPSPSPEKMADAIINHLSAWRHDPASYKKLRTLCRRFVEERYSWEANVSKTEQLFFRMAR